MQIIAIPAQPHVFISMPISALAEVGIAPDDAFEISVDDKKIIIQKADPENYVCDGDCANCPFSELECDNTEDGGRTL